MIEIESLIWIVTVVNFNFECIEGGNLVEVAWPSTESFVTIKVDVQVFKLGEFLIGLTNRTSVTTEL